MKTTLDYKVLRISERPELRDQLAEIDHKVWPRFMLESPVASRYWNNLFTTFSDFQLLLLDAKGTLVAGGLTIPIFWDGTIDTLPAGWDQVLELGVRQHEAGIVPNAMSALAAVIDPEYQGKGLSAEVLKAMQRTGAEQGFHSLIAPVRPTLKPLYPLTPIERYARWTRSDGTAFDPWVRVHARLGAEIIAMAPGSMYIPGTVTEWEDWAGMLFPESGEYVVPGALCPVSIDREANLGVYIEPNIWMLHRL